MELWRKRHKGEKKRHIAGNMFRDVKPTSDITPFTMGGSAETVCVCVCVWTISVSMHFPTGFVEREDREDICMKALRFHFDCGACLCIQECVFVHAFGRFPSISTI